MPRSSRFKLLVFAVAVALSGCAQREAVPPAPSLPESQIPWTAAIGKLVIAGSERPCTAILVAPDLIATAAHCLHQNAVPATAADITFLPNHGAEPQLGASQGITVRAMGGAVTAINKASDIVRDWALITIAPPQRGVSPIAARPLVTDDILARIAAGETLYTAGYGNGVAEVLRPHSSCKIVKDPALNPLYAVDMVVTTCIIRIGDSGGPIILVNQAGQPTLFGIFAGFGLGQAVGISYGVNVSTFADRLPAPLVSGVEPQVQSPVFRLARAAD
nr:trypsin-like serine protease [uncultured Dongia sp.]